jgi:hydroxymethylbilane synthase|tara:strand:+ start:4401 stop:5270 length:870 start_codon:yes stop_codon:yes gene_type:complete
MWQAHYVKSALQAAHPQIDVEIIGMTTEGDRNKVSPLSQIGGKGVFVKELEVALLENRADIAVHSMKDVPSILPAGLSIEAICQREDPRDALVCNHYTSLADLPAGSKIGSSSLRRRLQLKHKRPDLDYIELRGNVGTRLERLDNGDFDAIILATAGLIRLGLSERITERIDPLVSIPSAGQGAVGIECRSDDKDVIGLLKAINHQQTFDEVVCERRVSSGLGATCNLPIAAFAVLNGENMRLSTYVSDNSGERTIKLNGESPRGDAIMMADRLTQEMIGKGANELIGS